MISSSRIAIIGAGHVGATTAYALMLRALFREIVLIDEDTGLAEAEAADLSDANALARPARIWAGDYGDAAAAQIAVVTAGAASHGKETRLALAARSAAIVRQCATNLAAAGFEGVLIVAANPVDLMSVVAFRHAGLLASRVLGTGTLLDTSRFRQALAERLDIAARSISGYVVGEHGDSEVAAFSTVRIGGVGLRAFSGARDPAVRGEVATEVREAGYRIIAGKGYTSFGIATAVVRICEAIVRDERAVVPVSTMLTGQYGLSDLYLSLPCVIGAAGVVAVLEPEFTVDEVAGLCRSADILGTALAGLAGT